METITLNTIEGISRLSGTDENGCEWIQFEVDYLAEQEDGECSICGQTLSSGWTCLDGGEEVCDSHVQWTPEAQEKYDQEVAERLSAYAAKAWAEHTA
jgi:hypothetical protein